MAARPPAEPRREALPHIIHRCALARRVALLDTEAEDIALALFSDPRAVDRVVAAVAGVRVIPISVRLSRERRVWLFTAGLPSEFEDACADVLRFTADERYVETRREEDSLEEAARYASMVLGACVAAYNNYLGGVEAGIDSVLHAMVVAAPDVVEARETLSVGGRTYEVVKVRGVPVVVVRGSGPEGTTYLVAVGEDPIVRAFTLPPERRRAELERVLVPRMEVRFGVRSP